MPKTIQETIIDLIYDLRYLRFPEFTVFTRYLFEEERIKIQIEEYLDGQLTGKEKEEFETRLKNDHKIREELTFRKRINDSIKNQKISDDLNLTYRIYSKNQKIKNILLRFSVAACIAVILGTVLFFVPKLNTSPENIYASYYQPLDQKEFSYSDSDLAEGKKKYFDGDYKAAFYIYSHLPHSVNIKAEKSLFTALSLIELGSYEQAIEKLKEGIQTNKKYSGYSYWYLGLCYLKTNQIEQAKTIFRVIDDNKSFNYKKASKILKKLG